MINWAAANPFAKAERQQTTQQESVPKKQEQAQTEFNEDGTPKVKNKQQQQGDDPLLQFESLWHPNTDKDGKEIKKQDNSNASYLPKIDNAKLNKMLENANFLDGVTEEEVGAITAGGDKAVGAMTTMINRAARKAFTMSLSASSRLAEAGVANARKSFMDEVPNLTKDMMIDSDLASDEVLRNPALAPVVKMVKGQYLEKFPKAGAGEVNNAVRQYFKYLGGELTKKPKTAEDTTGNVNAKKLRTGAPDADFLEWLGNEAGSPSPFQDTPENPEQQQ